MPKAVEQTMQQEVDPAFVRSIFNVGGILTGAPTTAIQRPTVELMEGDEGSVAEMLFGTNPFDQ